MNSACFGRSIDAALRLQAPSGSTTHREVSLATRRREVSLAAPVDLELPTQHSRWDQVMLTVIDHLAANWVDFSQPKLAIKDMPLLLLPGTPLLAW